MGAGGWFLGESIGSFHATLETERAAIRYHPSHMAMGTPRISLLRMDGATTQRGWRSYGCALWGCLVLILGALVAPEAGAQVAPERVREAQSGAGTEPNFGTGRVRIQGVRLGVGERIRPGSWAGVLVEFQNQGDRELEVLLRVEIPDADGDRALYERVVTANPGVRQSAWLYARLPHSLQGGSGVVVSTHEAIEAGFGETPTGFRAGDLYDRRIAVSAPSGHLSPGTGMIGVLGRFPIGLGPLGERRQGQGGGEFLPQGHERTEVVGQLQAGDLPDRWLGLESMHTLIWAGESPTGLRADAGEAIAEWVMRGGHMVVILPPVGQEWLSRGGNELFDLLPRVRVTRREGVAYERLRPMLTREPDVALPELGALHVLEPEAAAERGEARVILATPEGEPIVVRRLVGAGAVTVIGLDLSDGVLRRSGLPEVGMFWNRVLGRRGTADPRWRLDELGREGIAFDRSDSVFLDDVIGDEIAKTGRAAAGVLLGVIVFALYWAIAGPVGYAVLRGTKRTRHAWMAFLLTGAAFTAIAWGGATALRPKTVSAEHLTFLTHVHGQPVQRARSWASLLIPDYGSAVVRVGDDDAVTVGGRRYRLHHALAAWETRSADQSLRGGFPDTRSYSIEARDPSSARFPARQTVKQVRADWAGATTWGGMPRVRTPADGSIGELRVSTASEAAPWQVEGQLVHDLPGELRDVRIIVVKGQVTLGASPDLLAANAGAFALRDPWSPGSVLDLGEVTGRTSGEGRAGRDALAAATFLENLTPTGGRQTALGGTVQIPLDRRLVALALYGQLQPPQLMPMRTPPQVVSLRSETHGLDLGRWFTEPCVIVVGTVVQRAEENARGPIPLTVNGQAVRSGGRTVVAWVYPLPDEPPRVRLSGEGAEEEGDGALRPAGTLDGNG